MSRLCVSAIILTLRSFVSLPLALTNLHMHLQGRGCMTLVPAVIELKQLQDLDLNDNNLLGRDATQVRQCGRVNVVPGVWRCCARAGVNALGAG